MIKKLFFTTITTLCFVLSLVSISCTKNNDSAEKDFQHTDTKSNELYIQKILTPFNLKIEEDVAYISFVQTPRLYAFDATTDPNNIAVINKAIHQDTPLRIRLIDEYSNEIIKIEESTSIERMNYKSTMHDLEDSPIISKQNLKAVIPSWKKVLELEKIIKKEACGKNNSQDGCIPFQYVNDGCYSRAHRMRELLSENGYDCQKVFIFGVDKYLTAYNTDAFCCVKWGWHVSVLVKYKNELGKIVEVVIDPSLFNYPISKEKWFAACMDNESCNSFLRKKDIETKVLPSSVYYYSIKSNKAFYDDTYENTKKILLRYKDKSGCY